MSQEGFAMIPRSMLYDESVPRDAKLVYLMLSSHAGGEAMSWPSHRRIAACLDMSLAQVKRMLNWLRDQGYVTWEQRRREDDALTTNEYTLLVTTARTPASKPGSVRAHPSSEVAQVGSGGAEVGSEVATPQLSQSGGIAPRELVNESHLNESQGTTPRPLRGLDAEFDQFWAAYPRHEGKAVAKVKFAAARKKGIELATILAGAKRYADDPNREPQYTAHASTWLYQGRWDDEPLPARGERGRAVNETERRPSW